MAQYGGETSKNPPWFSQNQSTGLLVSQPTQLQPQIMAQLGNNAAVTMIQYPQTQVYQQAQLMHMQQPGLIQTLGVMGSNPIPGTGVLTTPIQSASAIGDPQQVFSQLATVSYPSRTTMAAPGGASATSNYTGNQKQQRVFTGTVTKVQDNFGFVDEEVFFQSSCCQGTPSVGDRVLVDATYNANMPFKWNATKVQVLSEESSLPPLPPGTGRGRRFSSTARSSFVGTPEGENDFGRRNRDFGGNKGVKRNRRNFNRKRRREQQQQNVERPREEKEKPKGNIDEKERPKSPPRKVSKTTKSRKVVDVTRALGQISLDMPEADVLEVKKRYPSIYVPSDFIVSSFKWVETFPPHKPLTLEHPTAFHVLHKDVEQVIPNKAVLDPPDANHLFSAKVMLLSMPELDEIYKKCCSPADGQEDKHDVLGKDLAQPASHIEFLVGLRGKNETMAIGGPWSPSLDGLHPEKEPSVLIKTAIRTCKALTGIDLAYCMNWYRFVEIYYHRTEAVHKGKTVPARVETVVLFVPDVWGCLPSRLEWDGLHLNYKKKLNQLLIQKKEAEGDDKNGLQNEIPKKEPTYYAQLDPKNMKLTDLREELDARNLPSKGMTSQLAARLAKALKSEQDKEETENAAKTDAQRAAAVVEKLKEEQRKKKEEEERKKQADRDLQLMEKRYTLPEKVAILVHPSREAKSGKFDCVVKSLSSLLDYKQDDAKEHSFEVSLFAELFNEMLMRDFGFNIYKYLVEAPEKPKEEKDDKDTKDKDKKSENKKKDGDEKDEKEHENSDDKKKKERVKLVTVDPYLLLAFVYFDPNHHSYIYDKDLEELLFSLGLSLSRAQIKKLMQKVESRGSVYYRKLTDKPKDDPGVIKNGMQYGSLVQLGFGNKILLPIFDKYSSASKSKRKGDSKKDKPLPSGSVMFKGSLLDLNKLQEQFRISEDLRLKCEKELDKLRNDNVKLKCATHRTSVAITKLSTELQDLEERLTNSNSELTTVDVKTKWYLSLMTDIYEKLGPVFDPVKVKKEGGGHDIDNEDVEIANVDENNDVENVDVKRNKESKPKEEMCL